MNIFDEIKAEREAQDKKWGGSAHDDEHDGLDWLSFILDHAAKTLSGSLRAERGQEPSENGFHDRRWTFTVHIPPVDARNPRAYRKQLIRVAALAVAAIDAFNRRHAAHADTPSESP